MRQQPQTNLAYADIFFTFATIQDYHIFTQRLNSKKVMVSKQKTQKIKIISKYSLATIALNIKQS